MARFCKLPESLREVTLSPADLCAAALICWEANFHSGQWRGNSATLQEAAPLYSLASASGGLSLSWAWNILQRLRARGVIIPQSVTERRYGKCKSLPAVFQFSGYVITAGKNKGKRVATDANGEPADDAPGWRMLGPRLAELLAEQHIGLFEGGFYVALLLRTKPGKDTVRFTLLEVLDWFPRVTKHQARAALETLHRVGLLEELSHRGEEYFATVWLPRKNAKAERATASTSKPNGKASGAILEMPEDWQTAERAERNHETESKPNGKPAAETVQHAQQNGNGADDFPYSMPFDQRCLYEWERGLRNYDGHESEAERDDAWAFAERLREWVLREAKPSWRDRQLWEAAERLRPNLLKGWEARKANGPGRERPRANGNGRAEAEPTATESAEPAAAESAPQADTLSDEAVAQFVTEYHNARWPGAAFGASDIMRFFLCKRHGLKAEAFNMPVPQQIRELARKIDSRISFAARWNADAFWAEALKNRAALQSPGTARTEGLEHVGSIAERMLH